MESVKVWCIINAALSLFEVEDIVGYRTTIPSVSASFPFNCVLFYVGVGYFSNESPGSPYQTYLS